jgi:antitoxin MazE
VLARPLRDTYCLYDQRKGAGMSVTLHKWGNSVGLRVPKPLLEQLGLKEGAQVDLKVEGDRLVIERHRPKRLTLQEVLKGFTPDDQPGEVDWGPPVGKEVW